MIGVVAVKGKEKTYVGIHRLSTRYWKEWCGKAVRASPSAESRWRARLKKSALSLEQVQETCIKSCHQSICDNMVSTDKRMVPARGPVWHRKQQAHGSIPKGLRGLATEGTWS